MALLANTEMVKAHMSYIQLTEIERHQIYTLLKNYFTQRAPANELGVSKSRISREISRNKGARGYRPKQAHNMSSLVAEITLQV